MEAFDLPIIGPSATFLDSCSREPGTCNFGFVVDRAKKERDPGKPICSLPCHGQALMNPKPYSHSSQRTLKLLLAAMMASHLRQDCQDSAMSDKDTRTGWKRLGALPVREQFSLAAIN
jgi:hypothetical protein